jgi:hypothetical protein
VEAMDVQHAGREHDHHVVENEITVEGVDVRDGSDDD